MFFQAQIEQWIDFSSLEIDSNVNKWLYPRLGYGVYLPPVSLSPQHFPYLESILYNTCK